jgi:hypothetical protein
MSWDTGGQQDGHEHTGMGVRMAGTGKWLVSIWLGLLLALPSASAQTSSGQSGSGQSSGHKARHHNHKAQQQVVLPPAPTGPLPQVPLDQLPAAPPQVDYRDGRLTIVAENSTLGDILREVRKQTGASIEFPPSANERVVAKLGPAPARDVLATLLDGSSFNYVLVGSVTDPRALASVTITSRTGSGEAQTVAVVDQPSPAYTPPDRAALGPGMPQPPGRFFPGGRMMPPQPGTPPAVSPQAADDDDSADADQEDAENQGQTAPTPTPPPDNGLGLQHGADAMQQNLQKIQQMRQQQGQPGTPPNN